MSKKLSGNVLVIQEGAGTITANAALAGVINESLNHDCIKEIYASLNGFSGILTEDLIDLAEESQQTIHKLRYTPGNALGVSLKTIQTSDFKRITEVIIAHNIRYCICICEYNAFKSLKIINEAFKVNRNKMQIIVIPQSFDNSTPVIDHSPGYGSTIKHLAMLIRNLEYNKKSNYAKNSISIIEINNQKTGWIVAGSALAKRRNHPEDAPHILLLPEVPFVFEEFISNIQEIFKRNRHCVIVASDKIVDKDNNLITNIISQKISDIKGKTIFGGTLGEYLKIILEQSFDSRIEVIKPGSILRSGSNILSNTDNYESFLVGKIAVKEITLGKTDQMIVLLRSEKEPYSCETSLIHLDKITEEVNKQFPKNWISENNFGVTFQYNKYALPLIQGIPNNLDENGFSKFAELKKHYIEKKLSTDI